MKKLLALILPMLLACGPALGEGLVSLPEQRVITRGGIYRVRGSLEGGQLMIDCGKDEAVTLILEGVEIASPSGPAIEAKKAGPLRIVLENGSQNILRAGEGAKAALFSKPDLALEGTGALSLEASGGHGIQGKREVTLSGGVTRIRAKKNGVKAGGALRILGGSHLIEDSQEGLEGNRVLIAGGETDITARDDGVNAAGAGDVDPRQLPDPGGENHWIRISGGRLVIKARGDGIDANGDLVITGGDIRISGPVSGQDGALDAHGEIAVSGGSLMAFGAADEAEGARDAGQSASLLTLKNWVAGGQEVRVKNAAGESLLVFIPAYEWNSAALSSPDIPKGERCSLWAAGQKLLDFVMGEDHP